MSNFVEVYLDEETGRLRHFDPEQLCQEVGAIRAKEEILTRIKALQWGMGMCLGEAEVPLLPPGARYWTPSQETLRMWIQRLRYWENLWNASHPGLDCRTASNQGPSAP